MVIQPQSGRRGFTLIEMLAVLAIIGIILAAGLPAVMSLMKSGGVSAASRQVSNTISLARQYAITQRTNTRVIFAYNDTQSDTLITTNLWYIGYTVIVSNRNVTGPQPWQYVGKWEYLPMGAVFLNAKPLPQGDPNLVNIAGWNLDDKSNGNNTNNLQHASIPYPTTNSQTLVKFAYMEFGPTGALTPTMGAGGASLTISGGFLQPDPYPTPFRPPNSISNYVNIAVDSFVGRTTIQQPQ